MKYNSKIDLNFLPVVIYFYLWVISLMTGSDYIPRSLFQAIFFLLMVPVIIYSASFTISKTEMSDKNYPG